MSTEATEKKVFVPGKVILAGEFAVLNGHPALAMAVDKQMTIESYQTEQSKSRSWMLESQLWNEPLSLSAMDLVCGNYPDHAAMVCETLRYGQNVSTRPHGIRISCDWPLHWGLGSSSALRLGLLTLLGNTDALNSALALQRIAQGYSSGCDTHVQFHGGAWNYCMHGRSTSLKEKLSLESFHFFAHPQKSAGEKNTGASIQSTLSGTRDAPKLNTNSQSVYNKMLAWFANQNPETFKDLLHSCTELRSSFADTGAYTGEMQLLERLPGIGRTWEFKGLGAWGAETFLVLCRDPGQLQKIRTYLENMGCMELEIAPTDKGISAVSTETREAALA